MLMSVTSVSAKSPFSRSCRISVREAKSDRAESSTKAKDEAVLLFFSFINPIVNGHSFVKLANLRAHYHSQRHMFIVSLTYKKPIPEIEKHIAEHNAFLEKLDAQNNLIFSGRKNPRTGGVIVVYNLTKLEIEGIVK